MVLVGVGKEEVEKKGRLLKAAGREGGRSLPAGVFLLEGEGLSRVFWNFVLKVFFVVFAFLERWIRQ